MFNWILNLADNVDNGLKEERQNGNCRKRDDADKSIQ